MSAHTPGPWSWGPDYQGLYGSGKDNDVLKHFHFEGMHLSYGPNLEANARLIAAAPDLLAALREYTTDSPKLTDRERKDKALAAIAKAEGTP